MERNCQENKVICAYFPSLGDGNLSVGLKFSAGLPLGVSNQVFGGVVGCGQVIGFILPGVEGHFAALQQLVVAAGQAFLGTCGAEFFVNVAMLL